MGIQPDIMVARTENTLDKWRLDRLSLFCNLEPDRIFTTPNVDTIYKVPLIFHEKDHQFSYDLFETFEFYRAKQHRDITKWAKNG